jgi:hypothetical protein
MSMLNEPKKEVQLTYIIHQYFSFNGDCARTFKGVIFLAFDRCIVNLPSAAAENIPSVLQLFAVNE